MACILLDKIILPRLFSHEYFQPLIFPELRCLLMQAVGVVQILSDNPVETQ